MEAAELSRDGADRHQGHDDHSKSKRSEHRRLDEEGEKIRNRKETLKRSRMWTTVSSSDRSGSDTSSHSDSSSDGEEISARKRHKHSSREEAEGKHSQKSKHHKKEKKRKKEKKKKKDKKSKSEKRDSSAVNQNEYGKYGIVKEEHFFHKQREFEVYMSEVKNIPDIMGQGKREVREYFKMFIEDYNTATMPHEKYYNYEQWEMAEYRRKQDKAARKSSVVQETFNDEEERKKELMAARAKAEKEQFNNLLGKMASDKDQREAMRRQDLLKVELQMAYKQGDMTTVRRLEKLLAPEEETGGGVKHPWA